MSWLLKLYPREWRRRYGAELEDLVASHKPSLQLAVDLLGGAVDAHLKPQAFAQRLDGATASDSGGRDMVTRLAGCCSNRGMSRKDALFSAALTIGSALVVAGIMMSPLQNGENIGLVMFPGVLAIGGLSTQLSGHSWPARLALMGGLFVVLFLIGLATGAIVSD